MVYLNKVATGTHAKIAAKLEIMEPCCSVKDRCGVCGVSGVPYSGLGSNKLMFGDGERWKGAIYKPGRCPSNDEV